jgi:hypothetical protein
MFMVKREDRRLCDQGKENVIRGRILTEEISDYRKGRVVARVKIGIVELN